MWVAQSERRLAEVRAGRMKESPAEDVFAVSEQSGLKAWFSEETEAEFRGHWGQGHWVQKGHWVRSAKLR